MCLHDAHHQANVIVQPACGVGIDTGDDARGDCLRTAIVYREQLRQTVNPQQVHAIRPGFSQAVRIQGECIAGRKRHGLLFIAGVFTQAENRACRRKFSHVARRSAPEKGRFLTAGHICQGARPHIECGDDQRGKTFYQVICHEDIVQTRDCVRKCAASVKREAQHIAQHGDLRRRRQSFAAQVAHNQSVASFF